MRRFAFVVSATLLAGCGSTDKPAAAAATPAVAAPPAAINMADVAGTWTVKTMGMGSDSVLVQYTLKATATETGWSLMLPNRKPMTPKVMISGDSITLDVAPYESVLRKGTKVTTHGVLRLKDGKLVGTNVAHYSTGPDSVRNLRTEGTKNP